LRFFRTKIYLPLLIDSFLDGPRRAFGARKNACEHHCCSGGGDLLDRGLDLALVWTPMGFSRYTGALQVGGRPAKMLPGRSREVSPLWVRGFSIWRSFFLEWMPSCRFSAPKECYSRASSGSMGSGACSGQFPTQGWAMFSQISSTLPSLGLKIWGRAGNRDWSSDRSLCRVARNSAAANDPTPARVPDQSFNAPSQT